MHKFHELAVAAVFGHRPGLAKLQSERLTSPPWETRMARRKMCICLHYSVPKTVDRTHSCVELCTYMRGSQKTNGDLR